VEVSRVVVLNSRCLIKRRNKLVDWKSNFIIERRIHLDGQGRVQVKSPGPEGRLWLSDARTQGHL
jgi:hypothetical protein